jgi:hypothetical protein
MFVLLTVLAIAGCQAFRDGFNVGFAVAKAVPGKRVHVSRNAAWMVISIDPPYPADADSLELAELAGRIAERAVAVMPASDKLKTVGVVLWRDESAGRASFAFSYAIDSVRNALATSGADPRSAAGSYTLSAVGSRSPPFLVSRIVPGEGTTVHEALLELLPDSQLRGQVVASFTDSGTVTDTLLLNGAWKSVADTIELSFQWSPPRWQGGPREFLVARVKGTRTDTGLDLPELGFLAPSLFGANATLHSAAYRPERGHAQTIGLPRASIAT